MSKKLPPIHPGEILREEFMKPRGLSSNALARALDVTPARINEIVRERRSISADTALRLARFFKTDVQSWLNLQMHYDRSNSAAHRTAARLRMLLNVKGPVLAANGDWVALAIMTWGVATTDEKGEVEG